MLKTILCRIAMEYDLSIRKTTLNREGGGEGELIRGRETIQFVLGS